MATIENLIGYIITFASGVLLNEIRLRRKKSLRNKKQADEWYRSVRESIRKASREAATTAALPYIDYSELEEYMSARREELEEYRESAPDEGSRRIVEKCLQLCHNLAEISDIAQRDSGVSRWESMAEIMRRSDYDRMPAHQFENLIDEKIDMVLNSQYPLRGVEGKSLGNKYDSDSIKEGVKEEIGIKQADLTSEEIIGNMVEVLSREHNDEAGELIDISMNWYLAMVSDDLNTYLDSPDMQNGSV